MFHRALLQQLRHATGLRGFCFLCPQMQRQEGAALCQQCNPSSLKASLSPATPQGAKCSAQAQTQLKNANKNKSSTAQAGAPVLSEVPLPLGWVQAVKHPSSWFPPSSWLPHRSHYRNMSSLLGANELASSKQNLGVVLGEFTPGIPSKWQPGQCCPRPGSAPFWTVVLHLPQGFCTPKASCTSSGHTAHTLSIMPEKYHIAGSLNHSPK